MSMNTSFMRLMSILMSFSLRSHFMSDLLDISLSSFFGKYDSSLCFSNKLSLGQHEPMMMNLSFVIDDGCMNFFISIAIHHLKSFLSEDLVNCLLNTYCPLSLTKKSSLMLISLSIARSRMFLQYMSFSFTFLLILGLTMPCQLLPSCHSMWHTMLYTSHCMN